MSVGGFGLNGIVTNGLVLNLDAANRRSFVSGSTSWYDLSGGNNTGTLNGPTGGVPSYSSANGGSIQFDGTDDYAIINYSNSLNSPVNGLTFSIWVNVSNNNTEIIAIKYIVGGSGDYYISKLSGNWRGNTAGGTGFVNSLSTYSLNTWYNLCLTWTSNTLLTFYVNGIFQGTDNTPGIIASSNYNMSLGRFGMDTPSTYMNGKISNVQLYNRALSATEVQQNYNTLKNRYQ